MAVPYESAGRTRQKHRTRTALVEAARRLFDEGGTPTVEQAADAAGVSRSTAYRYFPHQGALLAETVPLVAEAPAFDGVGGDDVPARVGIVVERQIELLRRREPQLRAALRLALDGPAASGDDRPVLRRGRALAWFEAALEPLAASRPDVDRRRLAVALRAGCGIESWVWMRDVAGVDAVDAESILRGTATAVLAAALDA